MHVADYTEADEITERHWGQGYRAHDANVKLLASLAAGMGTDAVTLRIRPNGPKGCVSQSVYVTPLNHAEAPIPTARGVIVPVRVNADEVTS